MAVSRTGERQVVLSWWVPPAGAEKSGAAKPFLAQGSAALQRSDIDSFQIRTSDGRTLVTVPVR